jgi:hypothetical protein
LTDYRAARERSQIRKMQGNSCIFKILPASD